MKYIKKIIFVTVFAFICSISNVKANEYSIYLGSNTGETIKSGDIIELYAGISCTAWDWPISSQKFTYIFDKNIFEVIVKEDNYKFDFREGWTPNSVGIQVNQITADVHSTSNEYNITNDMVGNNCLDNTNATIVTVKLKVKEVNNQSTKVQLLNENSYLRELNFNIHNPSKNNYLSSLNVEGYKLNSNFDKNTTEYSLSVPYETEKININASTEDSNASLTGTGEKSLTVGKNRFDLVVVAENNDKKVYTVNITRKEKVVETTKPNEKQLSSDTSLSKVIVKDSNKKEVTLIYDDNTKTYTGDVSSTVDSISFDIKCNGESCTMDKLGTEKLKEGTNEFKFTVTSQNGNKQEYKIIINKEKETKEVNTTGNETPKKSYLTMYLFIGLGVLALAFTIMSILYFTKPKRAH